MELMTKELIILDAEAKTKEEVIAAVAEAMDKDGRILDRQGYIDDVKAREASSSTAVGFGLATPHAKSTSVKEPSLAFLRLKNPIQWDDEEEVGMVFQIAVPSPGQGERHLEILAQISRQLLHEDFREGLMNAKSAEDVLAKINVK